MQSVKKVGACVAWYAFCNFAPKIAVVHGAKARLVAPKAGCGGLQLSVPSEVVGDP